MKAAKSLVRVYADLPAGLRPFVLNGNGMSVLRRRRLALRAVHDAASSERWDLDAQRRYVANRLSEVLEEAIIHTKRYQSLKHVLHRLYGDWDSTMEALEFFPAVERAEVAEDPESFLSRRFQHSRLRVSRTSGTTGTPLLAWIEPRAELLSEAMAWRRNVWAGWKTGDWIARLVGDPVIPIGERKPKKPGYVSHFDRRIYYSSYHLDHDYAERVAAHLTEHKPGFVMGYPSSLAVLCGLAGGQLQQSSWRPKAILYSSEPLFAHQESLIRSAFRSPIRGFYGCAERVVSASECEFGSLHLNLLDGFVEGTLGGGEIARISLVTGLANRAMPLVRYRVGDTIQVRTSGWCRCGRTLPVIAPVVTKSDDTITTPSGRAISPSILTWAFKDLDGLKSGQVAQISSAALEVRVVCDHGRLPAIRDILRARVSRMFFGEMCVEVTRVPAIETGATGKTRFVVREPEDG